MLLSEITKTYLDPKIASDVLLKQNNAEYKKIVADSPSLLLREGGDSSYKEARELSFGASKFQKARQKAIDVALAGMKTADLITAAGINRGFQRIFEADGMSKLEAQSEADFMADVVTGSSQLADLPDVFSKGEFARTFLTFMTFALNEWGIVSHDIVKTGLLKGDYSAKFRAATAISLLVASKMLEAVVRDAIRDLVRKKKNKQDLPEAHKLLAGSVVGFVPWFGPMISGALQGRDYPLLGNPVFDTLEGIARSGTGIITKKTPEARLKSTLDLGKNALSLFSGLPFIPLAIDYVKNNLIE
jgi:hypothetical protein